MHKLLSFDFWNYVARLILRNRVLILIVLALATIALATQWKNLQFTHTEANLLPEFLQALSRQNSLQKT